MTIVKTDYMFQSNPPPPFPNIEGNGTPPFCNALSFNLQLLVVRHSGSTCKIYFTGILGLKLSVYWLINKEI